MKWTQNSSDNPTIPKELIPELQRLCRKTKRIRIEITPVFQMRTLEMNALFHANLRRIETLTGAELEYVKAEIKQIAISMGYPFKRDSNGTPIIRGNELVPISSADATISEFNILFQAMDAWIMQNGIDMEVIWE